VRNLLAKFSTAFLPERLMLVLSSQRTTICVCFRPSQFYQVPVQFSTNLWRALARPIACHISLPFSGAILVRQKWIHDTQSLPNVHSQSIRACTVISVRLKWIHDTQSLPNVTNPFGRVRLTGSGCTVQYLSPNLLSPGQIHFTATISHLVNLMIMLFFSL